MQQPTDLNSPVFDEDGLACFVHQVCEHCEVQKLATTVQLDSLRHCIALCSHQCVDFHTYAEQRCRRWQRGVYSHRSRSRSSPAPRSGSGTVRLSEALSRISVSPLFVVGPSLPRSGAHCSHNCSHLHTGSTSCKSRTARLVAMQSWLGFNVHHPIFSPMEWAWSVIAFMSGNLVLSING